MLTLLTDAYDSVANVDAYWAARGNTTWTALSDTQKEVNIVKATDWIDRNFSFGGVKASETQRLKWPRLFAEDEDGFVVGETDAPWQVKEACALVADMFRSGVYDMEGIVTSKSGIKRKKVDVLETEYFSEKAVTGSVPTHVYQLLSSLTGSSQLLRS